MIFYTENTMQWKRFRLFQDQFSILKYLNCYGLQSYKFRKESRRGMTNSFDHFNFLIVMTNSSTISFFQNLELYTQRREIYRSTMYRAQNTRSICYTLVAYNQRFILVQISFRNNPRALHYFYYILVSFLYIVYQIMFAENILIYIVITYYKHTANMYIYMCICIYLYISQSRNLRRFESHASITYQK